MKKISLIIIDDNQLLRESLMELIEQQPDMNISAAFGENNKALSEVCALKPDILLMNFGLPNQNSLIFLKSLMKKCPATKVIAMDIVPIQKDILDYVEAGVSGFILKDVTGEDFLNTIRSVANEEKVLPSTLTGSLFSQIIDNESQSGTTKLIASVRMTKLEREMILLIADGFTNKEISINLHVSIDTVKNHFHNILKKMVLNTRLQFSIYASQDEDINL